jgi:hypothetical protein
MTLFHVLSLVHISNKYVLATNIFIMYFTLLVAKIDYIYTKQNDVLSFIKCSFCELVQRTFF